MTNQTVIFENLENNYNELQNEINLLKFQDSLLEEKIEGKLAIAEHTNIFLDIVFILLSVVLWVITMQGWRNSKDVENERNQLRELLEKDRNELDQYKKTLKADRAKFEQEYYNTIEETFKKIEHNKEKLESGYKGIQEKYEEIINNIKGVSEYYLELVAISHEPDLSERIFEYEKILKNSDKYNLTQVEKARVSYYLSITLYQLATKSPEAKNKIVSEWIKKASKYITSAINLSGEVGSYYYEKAKIELEKYRLQISNEQDFYKFPEKMHQIEEYFAIAFKAPDVEFYMFEEMILLLYDFSNKITKRPSEVRVILDSLLIWCEKSKTFDPKSYKEDVEEIHLEIIKKIKEQNDKLDK